MKAQAESMIVVFFFLSVNYVTIGAQVFFIMSGFWL